MDLQSLANAACRHLPEGWMINVCMENGAGWVELHDPDGKEADFSCDVEKTLEEQVNDALCFANGFRSQ